MHGKDLNFFSLTLHFNLISSVEHEDFLFTESLVPCNMDQNDTIGKIELKPLIVLSSDDTNCKNDIQLFHQLFDELSVHTDYH